MQFLSEPIKDGTTGTVIVLTTPDAQRTMLAYQVQCYRLNIKIDASAASILQFEDSIAICL